MRHKIRALLIVESANPEWASVPLEGWSLSRALAKIVDVHIVTHVRNQAAFARASLTEGVEYTAIDNERVAAPLYKLSQLLSGGEGKGWTVITAFSSLAYYFFEYELWRKFRSRIAAHEFDIVHRITPISPTSHSLLAKRFAKLNVPFVIGPLNGGIPWPKAFMGRQHAEREWLSHIRGLYKLLPYYRSTLRDTSAIIAGSKYTYEQLPEWIQNKRIYIPENGVDIDRFRKQRTRQASLPLKAAFVGRLVPYKGADMLLEAAADFLSNGQLEIHIIGDGPQRPDLEALVHRLGIQSHVYFHGWVPHTQVEDILRDCDFMALPSIREFGGAVVVESMALGVTPIVADYGGPSEHVDSQTGIRVKFTDKSSLVDGLRRAIASVVQNPKMLDEFGTAARAKVLSTLTWQAKAEQIATIYDAILGGRKDLRSLNYR